MTLMRLLNFSFLVVYSAPAIPQIPYILVQENYPKIYEIPSRGITVRSQIKVDDLIQLASANIRLLLLIFALLLTDYHVSA